MTEEIKVEYDNAPPKLEDMTKLDMRLLAKSLIKAVLRDKEKQITIQRA